MTLLLAGVAGCRTLPWNRADDVGPETNLSFTVKQNLIYVPFHAGGREGRGIVSTRHEFSIIDDDFAAAAAGSSPRIQLGSVSIAEGDPRVGDLQGIGDAILARDLWEDHILTLDWRSALVTLHRSRRAATDGRTFAWTETPRVRLILDGRPIEAEVDSTSPEAVVLPGGERSRRRGRVELAGVAREFEIATDPRVPHPRIGTQLLSHYLVQIDYGRKQVILWPNR